MKTFRENPNKLHFDPRLTPVLPHIWRTRYVLASILYTHVEYHKSPVLTENQQNLMKSFQETVERAFSGPFRGHKRPHIQRTRFFLDFKLGTHFKYHKSPFLTKEYQNLMKTFGENAKRAFFRPRLARNLDPMIFFQKSGFVTLFQSLIPNFLQKI